MLGSVAVKTAAIAAAALTAACPAQALAGDPAAAELIDAYSPILMLRAQEHGICDKNEEQFQPQPVGAVLGNPSVKLQRHSDGRTTTVVASAPTAADIAGKGDDYYLNLPGSPLHAGCTYARDFAELKGQGRAPPVTYAHIAREAGHSGLVVQYWFFYWFNQFNDVHEGDWEGMQIAFDADTPAQALDQEPERLILFQHGGGQASDWEDPIVEKEGTHPVVYPAAGSHATFYEPAVFVENGQGGAGLGCDNTTEPLRRLVPAPVQVPTSPAPGSKSQWLSFEGHWGQREAGYNTGPTGPNTKTQWAQPFTWMDEQRLAAPKLPGGALVGPAVTDAFCDTVAEISLLVNFQSRSTGARILLLAGAALLLAALVFLLKLTRWRPVETDPLRRRRAFGQLIAAAGVVYGRRWRVLLPMGLTSLLILGAFEGIAQLASELAGETRAGGFFGGPGGSAAPIGDTVNGLGQPVGFAIAGGAVISYLHLLEAGDAGIGSAYGLTLRRLGRLVGAQFAALLLILGLAVTVIGIPLAVKKLVDWQFVAQEVLFRDRSIREALRGSTEAVRAGWWWTARVVLFFWLIGVVTGPVLGFGLVFADFSLTAIDLLGSLVFALLLPYVATGRTLLYLDLLSREPAPAKPARTRWKPWRREPSAQPG